MAAVAVAFIVVADVVVAAVVVASCSRRCFLENLWLMGLTAQTLELNLFTSIASCVDIHTFVVVVVIVTLTATTATTSTTATTAIARTVWISSQQTIVRRFRS